MQPAIRHILTFCAILTLTTLVYSRISTSYFCGFDDFIEVHRAAFEDETAPAKIFTTTHFGTIKYRPLNRALNLVTYLIDKNSAVTFRIRNLLFHGLAILAVYWFGWLLFHSFGAAGAAACLFAVAPLTNQAVIGSVMTNTAANFLYLLSLALFIRSLQSGRVSRLVLGLICGGIAVYTYESSIVAPALMVSWMVLDYLFNRRMPSRSFLLVFCLLGGLVFGSYLVVRHYVVVEAKIPSPAIARPVAVVRNVILYSAGILVPLDSVLAADWLGTPLPKELLASDSSQWLPFEPELGALGLIIVSGIGLMGLSLLILFVGRKRILGWLRKLEWRQSLFLLLSMPLSILPLLLFNDHPSETYVYLPMAFYCLLLGYLLSTIPRRAVFSIVLSIFVLLYGSATWVRNQRVARCAETAQTILSSLSSLSAAEWKQGPWHISVAKAPQEINVIPYGFYNYYGLDTLGMPGYGGEAIQFAMQLAYDNGQLHADEFAPGAIPAHCTSPGPREACYWVHWDGRVSEFAKPLPR